MSIHVSSPHVSAIHVLSHEVINQIAAGEVVERPAHLVKELVENSIDAKATEIHIGIELGGRYIKITDNGLGIPKNDLILALQRHATSKINKTDDLWSLHTFGFRGEALASAAAVSKLTLTSHPQNQEQAFQIKSDFGIVSDVMPASLEKGTSIYIESLFENVPARLKFLKTDGTENAQVRNAIKAFALSHPHIQFTLQINGQLDLHYKKSDKINSLKRMQEVLDVETVYHQHSKKINYEVDVYFASPHHIQKTSKNIWIFVQDRWIQDRALQAAIMDAYRSLLMHGEYPQCCVRLKCSPELIDVNIHPTKSQIKFQNSSDAFRTVHNALRDGLESAPWLKNDNDQRNQQPERPQSFNASYKSDTSSQPSFAVFESPTLFKTKTNQIESLKALIVDITETTELGFWGSLQILGQLDLTYIVCQKNDRMILVDQHAAHERVAFEKLMKKWKGGYVDMQTYLFPLAIDLSVEKAEALMTKHEDILKMGIDFELLGPSVIGIKSAPLFVKESSLPAVFEKMSHDLVEYGESYRLEKSIADLFATMACHSVIRAGQSLSQNEMKELLISMDEFTMSSFCPHGRPVSIEFTFNQIEKLFGRIP